MMRSGLFNRKHHLCFSGAPTDEEAPVIGHFNWVEEGPCQAATTGLVDRKPTRMNRYPRGVNMNMYSPTTPPPLCPLTPRSTQLMSPLAQQPTLVIRPFKLYAKSVYSREHRVLCHIDAEGRMPATPDQCPMCERPARHASFVAFVGLKDDHAGNWGFVVSS